MPNVEGEIRKAAGTALETVLAGPIPIAATGAPGPAIARAAAIVAREVLPLVLHAANGEPWYRSRVTWGAILSAATPLLALAGWTLSDEHRDAVVGLVLALGPVVGAAVTLHGRWRAKTPIGG